MGSLEHRYPPVKVEEIPIAKFVVVLGGAIAYRFYRGLNLDLQIVLIEPRIYSACTGGGSINIFISAGNIIKEGFDHSEAFYIAKLLKDLADYTALGMEFF